MVIVDFWRNQNNQKGLTPANGISPNFISLQKVLSDSNNYIYEGPRTAKRGRPKTKDGKIDFSCPDKSRMARLDIAPEEGEAFELVAWCKSLKQKIRLVIHYLPGGGLRLYFSTDTSVSGKDVYDIYRTRFQIEFCFRDGHQFTGLLDCQARNENIILPDFQTDTIMAV